MNNVQLLYELVGRLVVGSVSLPDSRQWYVNYRLDEGKVVHKWLYTSKEVSIGPYPYAVAELIKSYWVPSTTCYKGDEFIHAASIKVALKPRGKGSIREAGPTKKELEALILLQVSQHLDTWRRLQEWVQR